MLSRAIAAVLAASALGGAGAGSAAAKPSDGETLYTTGLNCTSIILGNSYLERHTFSFASQEIPDDGSLAPGDKPFWVSLSFGSIGDICGGGGSALPEFVPPAGVEVVDDPGLAPYWTVYQNGESKRGTDAVVLSPGRFGGTVAAVRDAGDGQEKPWPYANSGGFITIHLALRTTRSLTGLGSQRPACPAITDSYGACPRDQSGDYLQVANIIADGGAPGTLVPILGLFATAPSRSSSPSGPAPSASGSPSGAATPSARPGPKITTPTRMRATVARRGIPVHLSALAARATVSMTLEAPQGRVIARARGRASASGRLTLRPKLSAADARRVRAAGGRLRLVVRVGGRTTTRTIRIT